MVQLLSIIQFICFVTGAQFDQNIKSIQVKENDNFVYSLKDDIDISDTKLKVQVFIEKN